MAVLAVRAQDAFVTWMTERLRAEAPEVTENATDGEIADFVRLGIERAALYGFTTGQLVAGYVTLMSWLGPEFDTEQRWAAAILTDSTLAPGDKLWMLEDFVMSRWKGAR